MAILASKTRKIQSITGLLNISVSEVYETTLRVQFNKGKNFNFGRLVTPISPSKSDNQIVVT
jgi:hypothetical protein